jgi:YidC/Oxa1 family membrane protein insertase
VLNFFYTLIIFPIEQIVELCYIFTFRISRSPGLSIIGLSIAVSTLVLPLYLMAEKQQQAEREKQKQMKRMSDNIKAVFKGDKRHMMLSTLYRQHNYHPVYALRGSLDLFIQIPFFIAAYHFLNNLEVLRGQNFSFFSDLGAPDGLLGGINFLPILMTLINVVSGAIYTQELLLKDKIQAYGIAAVFLLLLYNSPAALVLYWTCNNLYNLVKNFIIHKAKNPKLVIHILVSVFCFALVVYVLFVHQGWIVKRVLLAFVVAIIPCLPFLFKFFARKKKTAPVLEKNHKSVDNTGIFILSMAVFFILGGFFVPSSLIASSVQEFSFIENYESPFPFIANTALQSFGIFLLWPLCIYYLLPLKIKEIFAKTVAALTVIVIADVFLFPEKNVYLTIMFRLSKNPEFNFVIDFLNFFVIIIAVILVLLSIRYFRKIMISGLIIVICALVTAGIFNSIKISNEFQSFQSRFERNNNNIVSHEPIYQFTKNGKNVLVIMLDRAISGYIPYIFEENPELYNSFDGFEWYKNTISFGGYTNFGTPGLFGGYEYTPLEMQARNNIPLVEKHNQALLMLPRIFLDQGFKVTITDPSYANYSWIPDLSIFNDYPQIHVENFIGKYYEEWLLSDKTEQIIKVDVAEIVKSYLIRFSFFKFVPSFLRNFAYDNGEWLTVKSLLFPYGTLANYIALDMLPEITQISEDPFSTYSVLVNNLPHDPSFLQAPDYIPSNNITNKGNGPFANEEHYHVNIAALMLLGKWFDFFKENNVYNNTRIIIVSDHGRNLYSGFPDNIILPNGESLQTYTALLLVKDFDSYGILSVNDMFMTNADVPLIALGGIVENPVNPWTEKLLTYNKENGITITTSGLLDIFAHSKYSFNIKPDEWLHVHTDIFNPANWSQVKR